MYLRAVDPVIEPLWSAAQARAADAYTIEDLGVPGIVLMEHAGKAVADAVRARGVARAVVFAGPGNNGGDGWVIARHLWGAGVPCPVVTLRSPDELGGDASLAAQMFLAAAEARGWSCAPFAGPFFLMDLADDVQQLLDVTTPDVVVDALFGTGLSRALEGVGARVVEGLSRARVPVVAVDLPSGLPTDGEAPLGPCIFADETVTFAGKKIAHASEPGVTRCGVVRVVDIGILAPADAAPAAFRLVDARALVPAAAVDAHKGRFGHVLVVMGKSAGASRLAARASLRAGAGLASVLVPPPPPAGARPAVEGLPEAELMVRLLGAPSSSGAADALSGIAALVVGPGLGHENGEEARALLEAAAAASVPCVVDAEAVDVLVRTRAGGALAGLRAVVTPHPGEAARVLDSTSAEVQRDRVAALRALKERCGAGIVAVLKGSCPLVLGDDGRVVVVEGNAPALSVAGSGDVLAGAVGGLLARGMPPAHAALAAVQAHQRAGAALGAQEDRGHLAGEIADALPAALSR